MADDYSDILSNYQEMGVSELGTSLLKRQQSIKKANAKKARKDTRIQQVLAVMLLGAQTFKGAYNRRAAELENSRKWEILNNEMQTKRIRSLSSLTSAIPPDFHIDKAPEERARLLLADDQYGAPMREQLSLLVDPRLDQISGYEDDKASLLATGTYVRIRDAAGL